MITSLLLVLLEELHFIRRDAWLSSGTSEGFVSDVVSELCGVSHESLTFNASATNAGTSTDNTGVDGTSDAVLLLDVKLGQVEELGVLVCKVFFHVSPGGAVEHVSHLESLNSLVFWHDSGAVSAAYDICVALVILRSTVVTSLRWHIFINNQYI